eukprot:scaffold262_cov103-Isochrysis_galbana.AAC.1
MRHRVPHWGVSPLSRVVHHNFGLGRRIRCPRRKRAGREKGIGGEMVRWTSTSTRRWASIVAAGHSPSHALAHRSPLRATTGGSPVRPS